MIEIKLHPLTAILLILGYFVLILLPLYSVYYALLLTYSALPFYVFVMLLPIILLVSYIFFVILFIIELKIIQRLIHSDDVEGVYELNKLNMALLNFVLTGAFSDVVERLMDFLLINKAISHTLTFRLFGAKVGKNVFLRARVPEPHLLEIGDNSVIGDGAIVSGHAIMNGKVYLKKVVIGKNCTIGAHAIIFQGARIEDNVIVGANSLVLPDSILKKNGFYAGSPVVLKRQNVDKKKLKK